MNSHRFFVAVSVTFLLFVTPSVGAQKFLVDNQNSSISFKLDSTWHMIHGTAKEYSGEISFDDPLNPTKMTGKISIKAQSLDTGLGLRDDKLHEYSLETDKYPTITYTISGATKETITGSLTIRGATRPVKLAMTKDVTDKYVEYTATTQIKWADYGVKDPSIFIAKIDETVMLTIKTRIALP